MSSNINTPITRQRSTEEHSVGKDLPPQSNTMSCGDDCVLDQTPSFSMNEEQRRMKSFQERKSDVDQAIQWIVKEIKFLKQQDQNLMRQFVKLRSVLNSIKNRPIFDRKISLPESSPCSPMSPLHSISEESPTTFFTDEGSPGLRRRAQTEPQEFPVSTLCFDDADFSGDKFEHFAI